VDSLRVRPPRPDVGLDVVLTLDISASMAGADVAPLARAITGGIARAGHRVALQVFATAVSLLCGLTRDPDRLLAAAGYYEPAHPTNLENAVFAAHDLLARSGSRSRAGVILLVTDAEPTACGTPRRRARGFGAATSRLAALDAAAAARADGIAVCVLCPPPGMVAHVDAEFAGRLAAAGGGIARSYPASVAQGEGGQPVGSSTILVASRS
jgi:Mg-chelatase subunit ChlD